MVERDKRKMILNERKKVNIWIKIFKGVLILGVLFLILYFSFYNNKSNIVDNRAILELSDGSNPIKVKILITDAEREKGLSDTLALPSDNGMLFVFEKEGIYGFWMKDMNFAIDIVWLDKNFQIVGIEQNVPPESYPKVFYPTGAVKYVVEINANESKNLNYKTGTKLILKNGI